MTGDSGAGGFGHRAVLLQEVITGLAPVSGGLYVDATFGGGGHSRAILTASAPQGRVIGFDRDPFAIRCGQVLLHQHQSKRLNLVCAPFGRLTSEMRALKIDRVQGIVFDLGLSSHQLDTPERGFSFMKEGPLDMRMGDQANRSDLTAEMIVNRWSADELTDLFFRYGEERHARRLAKAIVERRSRVFLTTTRQLAELIERTVWRRGRIHPATRVFQALRIVVNDEMAELKRGLESAVDLLDVGGRVVVISFHSLEDRIVKWFFREAAAAGPPRLTILTRKPMRPSESEMRENARSRSAKMRVAEKCC